MAKSCARTLKQWQVHAIAIKKPDNENNSATFYSINRIHLFHVLDWKNNDGFCRIAQLLES